MEKKSKEALRRYKRTRPAQSSSDSSSSSDSDSGSSSSYSSSSSEKKAGHRSQKKKPRGTAAGARRSGSSSSGAAERRKREKQHACQKKLEAKRNHLKRKLKEAKLKKRAAVAAAAAAMGHTTSSHRSMSPGQQLKLKKLAAVAAAEKKHSRATSKERLREREREKLRAAAREHEHVRSRSQTKATKIRIHQDVKRKSPIVIGRHQLSPREKIIIQTRTRERTPTERKRELKMRHNDSRERERRDRDRADREAARNKEREEALARCQERQRERERIAREKLRREEEKKYERTDRLLPRPAEREMAIAAARGTYNSRERSLDSDGRSRHGHSSRSGRDTAYEREREYVSSDDIRRREALEREERREREYLAGRHRDVLSPVGSHYVDRVRDERDGYPNDERERVAYARAYAEEDRHRDRNWDPRALRDTRDLHDTRELNLPAKIYPSERDRHDLDRGLAPRDWKGEWPPADEWQERGYAARGKLSSRAPSEHDWNVDELGYGDRVDRRHASGWTERDSQLSRDKHISSSERQGSSGSRRWQHDWREPHGGGSAADVSARGSDPHSEHRLQNNFRRGGGGGGTSSSSNHKDYAQDRQSFRGHPPPLMAQQVGPVNFNNRFPPKRQMTYTNPNLIKKQQVVLDAAKAAATSCTATGTVTATDVPTIVMGSQPTNSNDALIAQAADADGLLFPDDDDDDDDEEEHKTPPKTIDHTEPEAGEIVSSAADEEAKDIFDEVEGKGTSLTTITEKLTNSKLPTMLEVPVHVKTEAISEDVALPIETGSHLPADDVNIKAELKDLVVAVNPASEVSASLAAPALVDPEEGVVDDLSEISDSDDDILDKEEPAKSVDIPVARKTAEVAACDEIKSNTTSIGDAAAESSTIVTDAAIGKPTINDDDDLLDFEEISDGELEEDSRIKGVGDALGVDWASLIKEAKAPSTLPSEQTTAKQKWQPHRIILDVGISMKMAGEQYTKRLLNDAKQKLDEELGQVRIKTEMKYEQDEEIAQEASEPMDTDDNKKSFTVLEKPQLKPLDDNEEFNVDNLNPIACIQVSERLRRMERRQMIFNASGPNSRALSARQDLKLRRQLCGLPVKEGDLPRSTVSEKMKAIALAAFQRALQVK